jgi:hypothetical protein
MYPNFFAMKIHDETPTPVISNPFEALLNRLLQIETKLDNLLNLQNSPAEPVQPIDPNRKIYTIKGLAAYIGCSEPTAVKMGKSGRFPRYQEGRKIFFYESDILKGMKRPASVNI